MSLAAHRLDLMVNALFLAAGCTYAFADAILYRLALVAILFMLRMIWAWALVRRAGRDGARKALHRARDHAMADQAPDQVLLDAPEEYRLLPPVASVTHRGQQ